MKKTLTINISGTVFHIDEDAYEKLKKYLSKISDHFRTEEGGHEIVNDIEARIAELFAHKTSNTQEVVTTEMVNEIIEVMGLPEDFEKVDDGSETTHEQKGFATIGNTAYRNKRLYRDPDSRVIGGVCGGLAHYLKMDKALVRILFFILFLVTSGAALLAYFILWIAVPVARTTSQKLEMKGEDVNIGNIGKSVKEEFSEMKENFSNYKNSKEYEKSKEYARKVGRNAAYAGREAGNVITKVFGAILLIAGLLSLIGLILGFVTASKIVGFMPDFIAGHSTGLFFDHIFSGSLATTMIISLFIIIGMPLLLLIYAGTKMLFHYYSNSRNIILTALAVWIIGIVVAVGTSVGAIDVFSTETSVTDKTELSSTSDTLFIQIDPSKFADLDETRYEFNNVMVMVKGDEEILVARPKFTIEQSNEPTPELRIKKLSKGSNYKEAKKNAENIRFGFTQHGSTLVLDPYFTLEENGKWRKQDLKITLKLPEGKTVFLNDNLLPIIHDIDNSTNTWDGDMIGKYWVMKPDGLTLSN